MLRVYFPLRATVLSAIGDDLNISAMIRISILRGRAPALPVACGAPFDVFSPGEYTPDYISPVLATYTRCCHPPPTCTPQRTDGPIYEAAPLDNHLVVSLGGRPSTPCGDTSVATRGERPRALAPRGAAGHRWEKSLPRASLSAIRASYLTSLSKHKHKQAHLHEERHPRESIAEALENQTSLST